MSIYPDPGWVLILAPSDKRYENNEEETGNKRWTKAKDGELKVSLPALFLFLCFVFFFSQKKLARTRGKPLKDARAQGSFDVYMSFPRESIP